MPVGNFRRGADEAAAAVKSGGFARTHYFSIEDGEEAVLRFLTDANPDPNNPHVEAWIVVQQHQMVPTKDKPEGWEGNWPKAMGAVCRYDDAFKDVYNDCYICDHLVGKHERVRKPAPRIWALAALRERVFEDGKLVGIKDVEREVTRKKRDKDGKETGEEETTKEKAIVVVNMGWKNFFNALQGFASVYGTILDRDYWIKRSGASTDTTYQIVNIDPIPGYDLRDPEVMKKYESGYDLAEIISGNASDEFYAKFFDPRVSVDKDGNIIKTGAPVESQAKPEGDVDQGRLSALAERVRGYKTDGSDESEDKGDAPAEGGLKAL